MDKLKKYAKVFDAALHLLAEYAAVTEETWDDAAVKAVKGVFDAVFGPTTFAASQGVGGLSDLFDNFSVPVWARLILKELINKLLTN